MGFRWILSILEVFWRYICLHDAVNYVRKFFQEGFFAFSSYSIRLDVKDGMIILHRLKILRQAKKTWFSRHFELFMIILDPWTLCRDTMHRRMNGAVLYRHQPCFFKKYNREILFFETFYVPGNLQSGQNSSKTDDYWLYPRQHSSELPGSLLTRPICRLISLTSLLQWLKLKFHPIKCQGAARWARRGNLEFFDAEHPT